MTCLNVSAKTVYIYVRIKVTAGFDLPKHRILGARKYNKGFWNVLSNFSKDKASIAKISTSVRSTPLLHGIFRLDKSSPQFKQILMGHYKRTGLKLKKFQHHRQQLKYSWSYSQLIEFLTHMFPIMTVRLHNLIFKNRCVRVESEKRTFLPSLKQRTSRKRNAKVLMNRL